jgi:hypothetical protein
MSRTPAIKRMYAHALAGMAQELNMIIGWELTSEGAKGDLRQAVANMTAAAELLKTEAEAPTRLLAAVTALGEAAFRSVPARGEQIIDDCQLEINHIRIELGYV